MGVDRAGSTTAPPGESSGFRDASAGLIVVGAASVPEVWACVEVGCDGVMPLGGWG